MQLATRAKIIATLLALFVGTSAMAGLYRTRLSDAEHAKVTAISEAYAERYLETEKRLAAVDGKLEAALASDDTTLGLLKELRIEKKTLRGEIRDLQLEEQIEIDKAVGGIYIGKEAGMGKRGRMLPGSLCDKCIDDHDEMRGNHHRKGRRDKGDCFDDCNQKGDCRSYNRSQRGPGNCGGPRR